MLEAARRSPLERLKSRGAQVRPAPDREILEPLPADQAVGYMVAALRNGTRGTVDDYRAFGGNWGFALHSVRATTRCWQGKDDTLVPMAHARRLAVALPGGVLQEVPAAGHFLVVTHGREVFGRLLRTPAPEPDPSRHAQAPQGCFSVPKGWAARRDCRCSRTLGHSAATIE